MELWGMRSTPSLQLLPGPHWPGVVAPDRIQSIGQIELPTYAKNELFELELFDWTE